MTAHLIQFEKEASRRRGVRRGAVLVVVIAVFAVTMALAGVWAKQIVSERRQRRLAEERAQVRWLADAGVRRAAARLVADEEYDGEEWSIGGDELGRSQGATVAIRVEAVEGSSARFRLIARANYPADKPRVRVTKAVEFGPGEAEGGP